MSEKEKSSKCEGDNKNGKYSLQKQQSVRRIQRIKWAATTAV
jgi:hypothetical protein